MNKMIINYEVFLPPPHLPSQLSSASIQEKIALSTREKLTRAARLGDEEEKLKLNFFFMHRTEKKLSRMIKLKQHFF